MTADRSLTAADIIRDREERRTDVTHEVDAIWARTRLVLSSAAEAGEALAENLITEEGHAWLVGWFGRTPGMVIRCNPGDALQEMALYSFDAWKRERTGRLSIEAHEPPPQAPTAEDEATIVIELSGPHETPDGWLFLAAAAPWKDRADLVATGQTPRAALDAFGAELERHLTAHAFKLRAVEERSK